MAIDPKKIEKWTADAGATARTLMRARAGERMSSDELAAMSATAAALAAVAVPALLAEREEMLSLLREVELRVGPCFFCGAMTTRIEEDERGDVRREGQPHAPDCRHAAFVRPASQRSARLDLLRVLQ